ncbi:MAG: hypothetical protein IPH12_22410, partial [Saprospirales bacterium]|nr:hypothetical protein [Saprospirales bacterium]
DRRQFGHFGAHRQVLFSTVVLIFVLFLDVPFFCLTVRAQFAKKFSSPDRRVAWVPLMPSCPVKWRRRRWRNHRIFAGVMAAPFDVVIAGFQSPYAGGYPWVGRLEKKMPAKERVLEAHIGLDTNKT